MEQEIVNFIFGILTVALGFILNAIWQNIKSFHEDNKHITQKINDIMVLISGEYVKRDEFNSVYGQILSKLDMIEQRFDRIEKNINRCSKSKRDDNGECNTFK